MLHIYYWTLGYLVYLKMMRQNLILIKAENNNGNLLIVNTCIADYIDVSSTFQVGTCQYYQV